MAEAVHELWTKEGWAFYEDGDLQVDVSYVFMTASLTRLEAVNLASALLQWATQQPYGDDDGEAQ